MNLNRLKDSGLLIQGFDEFVASWTHRQPKTDSLILSSGETDVLDQLPSEVRSFYEIVHRWRSVFRSGNSMSLLTNPHYYIHQYLDSNKKTVDLNYATIATEYVGSWVVVIKLTQPNQFELYTDVNDDWDYPEQWVPMLTPVDQFLVTLGFNLLITSEPSVGRSTVPSNSVVIFAGGTVGDRSILILQDQKNNLWITDEECRPISSARGRMP